MPDSARERYRRAGSEWRKSDPRHSGRHTGHAALFRLDQVVELTDFPEGGGFPKRFLTTLAYPTLGVTDPARVLHVCSGSIRAPFTVDRRPSVRPAVVADARALPFRDESFDWAIADPPYSREWGRRLYGITARQYPTPGGIVAEALRVLRPGGRLGLLHYMVPPYAAATARLVGIWGITVGPGSTIRAWTVLEKLSRPARIPYLLEDVRGAEVGALADRDETVEKAPIASRSALLCACGCGRPVARLHQGRPAAFALAACRQRAYRRRQADQLPPARLPPTSGRPAPRRPYAGLRTVMIFLRRVRRARRTRPVPVPARPVPPSPTSHRGGERFSLPRTSTERLRGQRLMTSGVNPASGSPRRTQCKSVRPAGAPDSLDLRRLGRRGFSRSASAGGADEW